MQTLIIMGNYGSKIRGKLGSKIDQKCNIWIRPVVLKFYGFQNAFNGCEIYIWGLPVVKNSAQSALNPRKWTQLVPNPHPPPPPTHTHTP